MHLADCLQHNGKTTIVYREANGVKKVFAVCGRQYKYVPQTIIADIAEMINKDSVMGKTETYQWEINHSISSIIEIFPEMKEDFEAAYGIKDKTPGIIIETSDIGCCSITIKSILKSGRGYVELDEIKFQHTPNTTAEKVLDAANKEIFAKIRKLPECLMSLIGEPLTYEEVLIAIEKCLDAIPRKILSMAKRKELSEAIKEEFDGSISYTKYDVADKFLELPDRISGLEKVTITEIRKACGKIPYLLEKMSLKEESILLL